MGNPRLKLCACVGAMTPAPSQPTSARLNSNIREYRCIKNSPMKNVQVDG